MQHWQFLLQTILHISDDNHIPFKLNRDYSSDSLGTHN